MEYYLDNLRAIFFIIIVVVFVSLGRLYILCCYLSLTKCVYCLAAMQHQCKAINVTGSSNEIPFKGAFDKSSSSQDFAPSSLSLDSRFVFGFLCLVFFSWRALCLGYLCIRAGYLSLSFTYFTLTYSHRVLFLSIRISFIQCTQLKLTTISNQPNLFQKNSNLNSNTEMCVCVCIWFVFWKGSSH